MQNFTDIDLNELLARINEVQAAVEALRPFTAEQEGRIMQKFRLDWNYHSNAIEGNSLTYGETIAFLMEGLTAKGKPFKDHLDIKGHNEGIDYLVEVVKQQMPLSEKMIRELHQIILVEPYHTLAKSSDGRFVEKQVTLGVYKKMPNHVKTPTGEIHYYATPEETPAFMSDLINWLREHQEKKDLHPLILAATFHYRFAAIHPFDDGNGRMARLLMNLLLMQAKLPPIVIKQEDRATYYYALRQADAGQLADFINYIGKNLLHSLELQLKGARGESMEEDDDLDKRIALLKKGLNKPDVLPINDQVVYDLVSDVIFPLLKTTEKNCFKLNDLFQSHQSQAFLFNKEKSDKIALNIQDWNLAEKSWKDGRHFTYKATEIFKIEYSYQWTAFKKSLEPFNISGSIEIEFLPYSYKISVFGKAPFLLTKPYGQRPTKEELTEVSQLIVKHAIEKIEQTSKK